MAQTWPPPTGITRPMVSGRWYDQQTAGVYDPSANTPVSSTPRYTFAPFIQWRLEPVNYAQIGLSVDVVPTVDVNIFLGIYSDSNGQPSQKLKELEITVLATDPTGGREFPFAITLKPGVYWMGFINDGGVSGLKINGWDSGAATEGYSLLGDSGTVAGHTIPKYWGWTSPVLPPIVYPATLPDSFLTTALNTSDRIPRLVLQVA